MKPTDTAPPTAPTEPPALAALVLLVEIVGDASIEQLEREAHEWRDSADLNEAWISDIRLRAARIVRGSQS